MIRSSSFLNKSLKLIPIEIRNWLKIHVLIICYKKKKKTVQKFKNISTNIFRLTGVRIFNTLLIQSCFFETEEKYFQNREALTTFYAKMGQILHWNEKHERIYMTVILIKPYKCSFDKTHISNLLYSTRITARLVK